MSPYTRFLQTVIVLMFGNTKDTPKSIGSQDQHPPNHNRNSLAVAVPLFQGALGGIKGKRTTRHPVDRNCVGVFSSMAILFRSGVIRSKPACFGLFNMFRRGTHTQTHSLFRCEREEPKGLVGPSSLDSASVSLLRVGYPFMTGTARLTLVVTPVRQEHHGYVVHHAEHK